MMYNQRNHRFQSDPNPSHNYQGDHWQDYYSTLAHYQPLCPTRPASAKNFSILHNDEQRQETYLVFLVNKGWWRSFICIVLTNALFILTYFKMVFDTRVKYVDSLDPGQPPIPTHVKSSNYNIMVLLSIISLVMINVSYLLTQFLNPGIRNLSQIPQQQLTQAKKVQFCSKCKQYKTEKFTHCSQCEVCIWNYDHHCGFFGKCVGGRMQFWAFLLFLASVTAGFFILLGCVTIQLGGTV